MFTKTVHEVDDVSVAVHGDGWKFSAELTLDHRRAIAISMDQIDAAIEGLQKAKEMIIQIRTERLGG